MAKRKTRSVGKSDAEAYLAKADQFLNTMEQAIQARQWDSAGLQAVHSVISASDALLAYERAGSRAGVAGALNALGEAARAVGDLDAATDAYRRSHKMSMAVGAAVTASVAEINLALVLLAKGDYRDARHVLQKALPQLERAGRSMLVAPVRVALLTAIAGTGD